MGKIERPIFFDADALICLLEWRKWGKVCKLLGSMACVAQHVAHEVKYSKDCTTGKHCRFRSDHLNQETVPRLFSVADLTESQHDQYLQYFADLSVADPGERETFAMAWVLEHDVCSRDTAARDVFFCHRPDGCSSKHMDVMVLLRRLKIIK